MKLRFVFISAVVMTLTNCASHQQQTSPEDTRFKVIESAAKDCTDYILNTSKVSQAKNITGKYSLDGAYYVTSRTDGAFTQTIRKDIPYAKSTYLDNGVEGSAWRACMKGQNALAPEITFG